MIVAEKSAPKTILVIHGPNLNMLGTREPEIYGSTSLDEIDAGLVKLGEKWGYDVTTFQSNHEGELVDFIQRMGGSADGIIINPAAYTHTSIALRDALAMVSAPIIEVHISNIHRRESFRHRSMTADIATGQIVGIGVPGYRLALISLMEMSGADTLAGA